MTRVVAHQDTPAPPWSRAGLVLPGLGHLLSGQLTAGAGILLVVVWLAWAAIAGFPRLGEVTGLSGTQLSWHGLLSVISWFGFAAVAWWLAWRLTLPTVRDHSKPRTTRDIFLQEFGRNRNGMIGLAGAAQLVVLTVLTPMIIPFDPDMIDAGEKFLGPSWAYLMGTDNFGRDLFSRVMIGARISLVIGFIAVGIAGSVGTLVGAVAAYFGGALDRVLMWFVDLLLSIPRLVLLLAIVGLFRPQGTTAIFLIVVVLGLTGWMSVSRIVRSQVLSLKEQEFSQAAKALGMSDTRIVLRHLIPNALAPVIVYASLAIGSTMLSEASLSFLGLGVQPPTATWGTLVADGRQYLQSAPWMAIWPGLCIVYAVTCFNLLGDGLRDALDPKQRGQ